jgi:RNA polymerase sigma-70 factor (ECF subfamily)
MKDGPVADADLVAACRQGDEKAFENLYRRYRLQLYSYLNKLLPGEAALVDDLYQQTWVRILDHLPAYREQQRFIAWLFRIAHNLVVDHLRRTAREDFIEIDERLVAPQRSPEDVLDDAVLAAALEQAIERLPAEQREVVLLRQEGVPFKEIAEIQAVSVNTVLGRMHYAVKKVQKFLTELRQ